MVLLPAVCVAAVPTSIAKSSSASPLRSALELIAVLAVVNSELKSAPDITFAASLSARASLPDQFTAKV